MNNSDETLEQEDSAVLKAIADLSRKIDDYKKESDIQLEAIRSGLVANHAAFDRLQARVLNIGADLSELTEEVRKQRTKETLELKN